MLGKIWGWINPYYYFIIAIPCMSMFPFRFRKKYKTAAIILAVLASSLLLTVTQNLLLEQFHFTGRIPFLVDQTIYTICIICACCIIYKGNPYSIILTVILAMSLAAQCGFIFGTCIELVIGKGYGIEWIILRDILGYGAFALYYFTLWKYVKLTSFYLAEKDHLLLIGTACINYLFTCYFTKIFQYRHLSMILFYLVCLFLTCSITFLIFSFTRKHQNFLEQQAIIQDMKLSENTLSQIQMQASQMKELKHELSNYIIYAAQLLQNKEYDTLSDYLSQLSNSSLPKVQTIVTGNQVLNAVLNQKIDYAKSLGIHTDFQVRLSQVLTIDDLTLCSLLGNLLNNAIEASKDMENAFIHFYMWTDKDRLLIKAENSTMYDVLKKNPYLLTTKKEADYHGNGMIILKKIVRQYNGTLHYEMTTPNSFSIQIILSCLGN